MTKHIDGLSQWFMNVAYKVHPWLGNLYETHTDFFNDGLVELICLLIYLAFTFAFSLNFIGLSLTLLLLIVATPLTFTLKYLLHKLWVWKRG